MNSMNQLRLKAQLMIGSFMLLAWIFAEMFGVDLSTEFIGFVIAINSELYIEGAGRWATDKVKLMRERARLIKELGKDLELLKLYEEIDSGE
jgi:hypothetical protein